MRIKKIVYVIILLMIIVNIVPVSLSAKNGELMTKDDFKIFVNMINKRFDFVFWAMGIGFMSLAGISLFLYKLNSNKIDVLREDMDERFKEAREDMDKRFKEMREDMDKRFKEAREETDKQFKAVDKRFEEVMSVILLLVKAHEKEIGSEAIDVALGAKSMADVAKSIEKDFVDKVEERKKEEFKEYLKDPEIMQLIVNEVKNRIDTSQTARAV